MGRAFGSGTIAQTGARRVYGHIINYKGWIQNLEKGMRTQLSLL